MKLSIRALIRLITLRVHFTFPVRISPRGGAPATDSGHGTVLFAEVGLSPARPNDTHMSCYIP
jgi:hypothetical protein